jgi:glycosyltransferase involved in cell wall biosynthesis
LEKPLISIIIATYNSSHLLKFAIQSVLDSDYSHWEMIVVGDCCTDDTSETVASFGDSRIRFTNLEENSGQQAKPNNVGLAQAKGKYIAFLNQDDMYFPSHLSDCVSDLEINDAEIIIVPALKILPSKKEELLAEKFRVQLEGVHPDGKFSTNVFSVASSWFFRKSIPERVGLWKMEKDLYFTPSQEWIFRASKSGFKFYFPSRVGVLMILSGERKDSYKKKSSFEHEFFYSKLSNSFLMAKMYEKAAIYAHKKLQQELFFEPKLLIRRLVGYPMDWILKKSGIHPSELRFFLVWGKRGNLIKQVRKNTGL